MAWTYKQTSGALLSPEGILQAFGYSGRGEGVNNPAMQGIEDVGPIPEGTYEIGEAFTDPKKGPLVMRINPRPGTETFGRSGFEMHGDNRHLNRTASRGCIIQPHNVRLAVSTSADKTLVVVNS